MRDTSAEGLDSKTTSAYVGHNDETWTPPLAPVHTFFRPADLGHDMESICSQVYEADNTFAPHSRATETHAESTQIYVNPLHNSLAATRALLAQLILLIPVCAVILLRIRKPVRRTNAPPFTSQSPLIAVNTKINQSYAIAPAEISPPGR